jgi:hypothetical protein
MLDNNRLCTGIDGVDPFSRTLSDLAVLPSTWQKAVTSYQPNSKIYRSWPWLRYLGLFGSVVHRWGKAVGTLSVSVRVCLPPDDHMLMLDFAWRVVSLPFEITGLYFRLKTLNIVPENAEIVAACRRGNVDLARRLFQSKRASISDVTLKNETLLCVSSTLCLTSSVRVF